MAGCLRPPLDSEPEHGPDRFDITANRRAADLELAGNLGLPAPAPARREPPFLHYVAPLPGRGLVGLVITPAPDQSGLGDLPRRRVPPRVRRTGQDRKSTRLNSS